MKDGAADEVSGAEEPFPDVRFGHDSSEVQDANGVDLLLLKKHMALSVEERPRSLEERARAIYELRMAMRDR